MTRVDQVVGRRIEQERISLLYDDMAFIGGDTIPAGRLPQPRVVPAIAFVLGNDLADGPLDHAQVREAVDYGVAALDVVAGNASGSVFVTGPRRVALRDLDLTQVRMCLQINGIEVSAGSQRCLDDPLDALASLARWSRERGNPLCAGEVVLAGATGPMCPVAPGNVVTARLSGLGAVKAYFG
ncbi:2-keto-4-pentenoate hydratase [Lentzea sp. NPDC058436]|uniref:2-keto-4-pentenoate hydratase n=1 Tax=Lentzea sp. NPDC058436 TaxID=3346499 RepID=UPI00365D7215